MLFQIALEGAGAALDQLVDFAFLQVFGFFEPALFLQEDFDVLGIDALVTLGEVLDLPFECEVVSAKFIHAGFVGGPFDMQEKRALAFHLEDQMFRRDLVLGLEFEF